MLVYIILVILLSILSLFRKKKWALLLASLSLLFIGGFRAESVGTDTANYELLFDWYGENLLGASHANEPGYALLQLLVVRGGLSYRAMVFFVQLITTLFLSFYAWRVSHRPQYVLLSYLLLFFYFYSFNTSRQYLAIPLLLIAYDLLDKRKLKESLMFYLAAIMFHNVAIIGILAIIFQKWKWTKSLQIVLLVLTFILGMTSIPQSLAIKFLSFVPSGFATYVTNASEYRAIGFSFSRFLLTGFTVLMVLTLKNDSNKLNILTLGICLLNLFAFQPVIGRLAQCFTIVQISIIPEIPYLVQDKYKVNVPWLKVFAFTYMVSVFIYLLSSNTAQVVPYVFGGLRL